jgi:hypothetical protein
LQTGSIRFADCGIELLINEPILDVDAALRYQEIVETIGWICPITASWVDYTASFGGK